MKRRIFCVLFSILFQFCWTQNKLSWQGYFSFNEIKDISQSSNTVFAGSENALFSKNTASNVQKTITTIDGLSGQTIAAIYYSEAFKKTLIGYENGLMIVINEDGSILKKVDIINKQLPSDLKKINHFMEYNGFVYVSCDFGIVQFNLNTMQFGDTYFIGDNGVEVSVRQTAYFNGFIFAATSNGIKRAAIANPNLIDFNRWILINSGNWSGVESLDTELVAVNTSGYIHRYNSNTFVGFSQLPQAVVDIRAVNRNLFVTTPQAVYVYNSQMIQNRQITNLQVLDNSLNFTCATSVGNQIFIGTKEKGLFSSLLTGNAVFENNTPSGPSRNNIFSLDVTSNVLWAVYGDYDTFYNPYPLDSYGVSKYDASGWLAIPYSEVYDAKSIVKILVNPSNENKVYASSFFSGLLRIENDVPNFLFNEKNSGLESLVTTDPNYIDIRVNGTAFDKTGNLWVTNSRVKNGLKVLKPNGQWQSYATSTILNSPESTNFGNIVIDKNNTKWIATSNNGVIAFNESNNTYKKITSGTDTGNLPTENVRVVAIDAKDQLWIGTGKGLRVLSNIGSFQNDGQLKANSIIIMDDNLAQELLYEQFITSIVVDGANNKWIGTADSGVFMVSPNGQETKYHFTINNSPLPSNVINDIKINSKTGEVFIATSKGMISFGGIATSANDDLSNVYVYPNPVRPTYTGTVKVAGLIDKANVKITDIEGNLVYETTSEGGTIEWDTTAFGRYKVASGVYMVFISAQDGGETKVKKVMIIR
ncbi:type IX secretion system anionic LPS delivery protein PorZ [Flavobacterium foetidum]|uniref:type IX secretion system anionic LPS delivery protein PorZ n=1 Tax=Flavobacterium foetidum TaxID=2026681 RepID=UPI001074C9C5|nr:T9SS type A sorting domain-containing protein [Flavobacterium foetidum]KAF2514705.1 T9SS type A sorting domain-containing protein [Flavobacterium foetidum]